MATRQEVYDTNLATQAALLEEIQRVVSERSYVPEPLRALGETLANVAESAPGRARARVSSG